jgi:hypothetical protein
VPFAGWVFDTTGHYAPAFRVFATLYAISMAAVLLLRLPAKSRPQEAPALA